MTQAQSVVITGASSGLGLALAQEYARRGATLCLMARRMDLLERLAASLPVRTYCYAVDVRVAGTVSAAAADFIDKAGCPDIVIANAGVSAGTSTADPADASVFEDILATNLRGMMLTFQPFVDLMRRRGNGQLAGIASVAGFRGIPGASAYSASKSAAITYLESLRVEMRRHGIRVVTICPGYIETPLTAVNPYPMPFLMKPEKAARSIANAIAREKRFHVLPWQMALVGRLLRLLPNAVYDVIFARAPRKPRRAGG